MSPKRQNPAFPPTLVTPINTLHTKFLTNQIPYEETPHTMTTYQLSQLGQFQIPNNRLNRNLLGLSGIDNLVRLVGLANILVILMI